MPDNIVCQGCMLAKDGIQLPGGWALNHYEGGEGYLGWLAIAPVAHRMTLAALSDEEQFTFMSNVVAIEAAMSSYRMDDRIVRFYMCYFAESLVTHPFHFHVHLIPRYESLQMKAWDMAKATKSEGFPEKYQKTPERIKALMDYLREVLKSPR